MRAHAVGAKLKVCCNGVLCAAEAHDGEIEIGGERIDEPVGLVVAHGRNRDCPGGEVDASAVGVIKVVANIGASDYVYGSADGHDELVVSRMDGKLRGRGEARFGWAGVLDHFFHVAFKLDEFETRGVVAFERCAVGLGECRRSGHEQGRN